MRSASRPVYIQMFPFFMMAVCIGGLSKTDSPRRFSDGYFTANVLVCFVCLNHAVEFLSVIMNAVMQSLSPRKTFPEIVVMSWD